MPRVRNTWKFIILLLQCLALARGTLGSELCPHAIPGIRVEEDTNIQLRVNCSQSPSLVTWTTPYPITGLFMMYSCSDAPDVRTKTKYYSGTTASSFQLEPINSNGFCTYYGCMFKIMFGLDIPVRFTNVTCRRTEALTGIPPTSQVMSSTHAILPSETTSYSATLNAIPTPVMNDASTTSFIIPTFAFVTATNQLSSSADNMEQLTTSHASIKAGGSGISKSLLLILIPSFLLFVAFIVAVPIIIFIGYSLTKKPVSMERSKDAISPTDATTLFHDSVFNSNAGYKK